jgi:tripartite-type tricarboxylate transporter receptor subunit TctC
MRRREVLGLGLAALSAPLVTPRARAQAKYPERPIRLVIPFPPGGVNDAIGRPWADKMKPLLGTVVIENMGGAGGAVGALAVARAQPDGYTLLLGSGGTQVIIPIASSQPTYDPVKAFETISLLGITAVCIVVHPSVPVQTLRELIAYAKANPGKLTFGAGSSSSRMSAELLKTMAGIDMLHVPYKSNPQAVTDLLGGQISLFFGDVSTALPPVRAGKLKSYAVSGIKRSPLAPDLPTIDEAGLKGYELTAWFAAYAPAKTPKPIIDKLNAAFREALKDKDVSEKLLTAGIEPEASTPDELRKFQAAETEKWKKIAADAKIEPE